MPVRRSGTWPEATAASSDFAGIKSTPSARRRMPVHAALRASVPTVRTGYGPVRRSDLGRWLAFDSSALTRNLRVLLDNKWLEAVPDSKDGRGLPLQVTKAGASLLRALGPAWHKAQGRALAMVGGEGRAAVIGLFDKVQAAMAA